MEDETGPSEDLETATISRSFTGGMVTIVFNCEEVDLRCEDLRLDLSMVLRPITG